MQFEFATSSKIIFGKGSSKKLPSLVKDLGKSRILVVHGNNGKQRFADLIQSVAPVVCVSVGQEPDIETLESAVAQALDAHCDAIVSIGGGSVIDLGKAIAGMVANESKRALDHMEVVGLGKPLPKDALAHIAIPSTSGTGSEVTKNAVIASKEHGVKASIRSNTMVPTIALVDPLLTLSCPPSTTASTGLDALTQCLEPYLSPMANPMTDALALQGMSLAGKYLQRAWENGSDEEAREGMSLCSLMGGLSLANAKLGAVHGCAGVIGGMFPKGAHGAVCAALLANTIKVNYSKLSGNANVKGAFPSPGVDGVGMLARYQIAAQTLLGNPNATVEEMVSWIDQLCKTLQVPGLSTYGMTEQDIPVVTEKSLASSSMKGNSVKLDKADVEKILRESL